MRKSPIWGRGAPCPASLAGHHIRQNSHWPGERALQVPPYPHCLLSPSLPTLSRLSPSILLPPSPSRVRSLLGQSSLCVPLKLAFNRHDYEPDPSAVLRRPPSCQLSPLLLLLSHLLSCSLTTPSGPLPASKCCHRFFSTFQGMRFLRSSY